MKYTKNIIEELLTIGFEFEAKVNDEDSNYSIWTSSHLEVKIDHLNESVSFMMRFDDTDVTIKSLQHLVEIKQMIDSITEIDD